MNKLDKTYTDLLQDILDNGVEKKDRTLTGTISVFGRQIRHKMSEGFPLLTTKKMPFKTIVTELLWFLRGDTNIKFLVDNNCHIWDGDAYKNYWEYNKMQSNPKWLKPVTYSNGNVGAELYNMEEFINKIKTDDEFANKWGELGPIYGAGWRRWNSITKKWWNDPEYQGYGSDSRSGWEYEETQIDQIQNLINDLKTNPDSRRLIVNAWNVGELDQMVLPPCHYGFQVYTRELSYEERIQIYVNQYMDGVGKPAGFEDAKLTTRNIPTRAISLMWNQRSVDTFLGLPFNIASYGLLLEIIAKEVNMVPDELIGNLGDVHLYSNHIEQAKEQIGRYFTIEERTEVLKQVMGEEAFQTAFDEQVPFGGGLSEYFGMYRISPGLHTRQPFPLPTLKELPDYLCIKENWECYEIDDIQIENYQSHPTIKAPLSN
jgi:thymidylate synthase